MMQFMQKNLNDLSGRAQVQAQEKMKFYNYVLDQVKQWLKTGSHPKDKIASLWEKSARAISKGKVGKSSEFGKGGNHHQITGWLYDRKALPENCSRCRHIDSGRSDDQLFKYF